MTKTDLENKIFSAVSSNNGLKGQELSLKLMSYDLDMTLNQILDVIFDMVERGDLIEIEYILPSGASKSFLVPRGTQINVSRRMVPR